MVLCSPRHLWPFVACSVWFVVSGLTTSALELTLVLVFFEKLSNFDNIAKPLTSHTVRRKSRVNVALSLQVASNQPKNRQL